MIDLRPYAEAIDKQKLRVEGLVVLQHGEKIAEHRWVPEVPRNIFSVSKSFTSVAAGIAVDEGRLSLGSRVIDSFPVRDPSKRLSALTLEHLLTMTRGYREFCRPRSVEEALSQELTKDPGEVFLYDNACTFLVSAMVTRAMGVKVRDLLVERLFRPLGIRDPVWPESDDGYTIGATALELTAPDMAKFGQFLLLRGNWEGKQIVSASWLEGAARAQVSTAAANPGRPDWDLGYGWQFWMCRHGAYRADGKDGQFIVVFPRQDAVAALTSNEENMGPILYALWDYVLPQL
ncbi:MAG: beta-lactamase family protein [Treponema sp.]|jgi:CubicO group peptidase (beta-lactamase class C family)|nr:beta-lactamase family protein [Treponema sp.]